MLRKYLSQSAMILGNNLRSPSSPLSPSIRATTPLYDALRSHLLLADQDSLSDTDMKPVLKLINTPKCSKPWMYDITFKNIQEKHALLATLKKAPFNGVVTTAKGVTDPENGVLICFGKDEMESLVAELISATFPQVLLHRPV